MRYVESSAGVTKVNIPAFYEAYQIIIIGYRIV